MRGYLDWRNQLPERDKMRDPESPLFLTDEHTPYTDTHGAWGGQNKSAWRGMRRRAAKGLRQQAASAAWALWRNGQRENAKQTIRRARDQATLVQQITPHWFRHDLATFMLSNGADIRAVMEQGGWRDMTVVLGYTHDVSERRRALVGLMDGGGRMTQT